MKTVYITDKYFIKPEYLDKLEEIKIYDEIFVKTYNKELMNEAFDLTIYGPCFLYA